MRISLIILVFFCAYRKFHYLYPQTQYFMNTSQKIFIEKIKQKIPSNISTVDEVAAILGISYDAAYRRMSKNVHFTLEESVQLARHLNISLNQLYHVGNPNEYIVQSSDNIKNLEDFNTYLINVNNVLKPLKGNPDDLILFSARELPMYYYFIHPVLRKYKAYQWFYQLNLTPVNKSISFKDFVVPEYILKNMKKLGETYREINLIEMWSFGAIDNALHQILYFFNMQLLNLEQAKNIIQSIKEVLESLELYTQYKDPENSRKHELYYNEVNIMDNSTILRHKGKTRLGHPYALLRYFLIDDPTACREQEKYIHEQIKHSLCISNTSQKEHAIFFNNKYKKLQKTITFLEYENNKPDFL